MLGRSVMGQADALVPVAPGEHLLMIGDWGAKETKGQEAVASGMKKFLDEQKIKPGAMFLLGDNFYGSMKGGVKSERWKVQFSEMYPRSHFDCRCYAVLGNHDYGDDPKRSLEAQLGYAKENPGTRWTMPSKRYAFDYPTVNPLMRVVAVDSNWRDMKPEEIAEQNQWLEDELKRARSTPWVVVMGHHPLYSNGQHGDSEALIDAWGPLFEEHRVDFYFCGHDHDLQHMEFEGLKTSFVLSGGGGARVRELRKVRSGHYAKSVYGFTHLHVTAESFSVQHVDANRNRLHAFSKTLDGVVTIV